jgi:simple sugar transport system permease protein
MSVASAAALVLGTLFWAPLRSMFGSVYGLSELLVRMTPLLLTAIAVALPARLGLINVGGEGQLYMGAWLATAGALACPGLPAALLLPLITRFDQCFRL